MRTYPITRYGALGVFSLHTILRLFLDGPNIWLDLLLYHLVAIMALVALFASPAHNDPLAIAFLACAMGSWIFGSILSSYREFFSTPPALDYLVNIAYTLFYPFALIAIPRIISKRKKIAIVEILDASIFGLGLSSIATALILSNVIAVGSDQGFFEILYPVCDLAIAITIAITFITQRLNTRFFVLALGFLIYLAFDYLYLWISFKNQYTFGTIFDNGWVLGLILISLSLWYPSTTSQQVFSIHPAFIALSIFISPTLLAMMALKPGIFPSYILIPTITTLFLAFIRMTVSLRQAGDLGGEKTLARTDELTGLPNRRRLIAELDTFSRVEGALMLLDLNGFKQVNDQCGHGAGDEVLIQVAARFARVLPQSSLLARLGGDEFGILFNGGPQATLETVQALKACVSYPFLIDGKHISVGVSIGHVNNNEGGDLLAKADAAMYVAKRSLNL